MTVWCEPLRTAIIRVLDGGQPRLRDLVFILADLWQATVRDLRILQVETQRDSTVLEFGHAAVVRRIARQRLGLTPQHEVVAAAHTPSGLEFGGPQAEDGGGGSVAARATTAEPPLKLSVLLDPALDSELACLPQARVREMFTSHVKLRGAESSEDVERTLDQVSALKQVITADLVPFADFSLVPSAWQKTVAQAHLPQLGLHARRLQAAEGTAWTALLCVLVGLFRGLPHNTLAVGRGTS